MAQNFQSLLSIAQRVHALAQTGLTYGLGKFDLERYKELHDLSQQLFGMAMGTELETTQVLLPIEPGYRTPKVDVRAFVLQEGQLLMVRERADGRWSLPGGWADVGYTPSEVAVKEVWEETQLTVVAQRLLALWDKKCHPHPPYPEYTYKVCIQCEVVSGDIGPTTETSDVAFFPLEQLPLLSENRITKSQIEMVWERAMNPHLPPALD